MRRLFVYPRETSEWFTLRILWIGLSCLSLGSCFLYSFASNGQASGDSMQQQYQQQSIEQHSFNKDTWKKATETLDYSDKRPPEEEEKKTDSQKSPSAFSFSDQTIRLIAFVVLFAVLIFILLKAFGVTIFPSRKKVNEEKKFSADQFDDDIPESELDRFLKEALQQNDFRLAIRIYYLIVIKELSQLKLINWRKEKTNFHYLVELRQQRHYNGFRDVTLIFERIWYGERPLDENGFREASIRFRDFLTLLRTGS